MFADQLKLLVTGAHGFIGSTFVRFLRRERPAWRIMPFGGSILNVRDVEQNLVRRPDIVVNFAAKVGALASMNDAPAYARTNVEGTALLLQAARRHGVRRFIQMSTVDVYGTTSNSTEESPIQPESPYGVTKAAADFLTLGSPGLEGIVVRAPLIYGPFDRPTKMIPLFISKALSGQPIELFGDGFQVREWIHALDVSAGVLQALEKSQAGQVYNLGSKEVRTNLGIVNLILKTLGKPTSLITFVPDRPGHGHHQSTDFSKAKRDLGFSPKINFSQEFPKTVLWYKTRYQQATSPARNAL